MQVDSSPARLTLQVTGLVIGVNFRWFTQRRALALGLTGWVRNCADAAVEITAEGHRKVLEQLLDAVRAGPPEAVVENVDAQWSTPSGEFHHFEIRY